MVTMVFANWVLTITIISWKQSIRLASVLKTSANCKDDKGKILWNTGRKRQWRGKSHYFKQVIPNSAWCLTSLLFHIHLALYKRSLCLKDLCFFQTQSSPLFSLYNIPKLLPENPPHSLNVMSITLCVNIIFPCPITFKRLNTVTFCFYIHSKGFDIEFIKNVKWMSERIKEWLNEEKYDQLYLCNIE